LIYEEEEESAPIRQGDIFANVPRIDFRLGNIRYFDDDLAMQICCEWTALDGRTEGRLAVAHVISVPAIVITQDCDAARSDDISLSQICPLRDVNGNFPEGLSSKKFVAALTRESKRSRGWFYLPPSELVGFDTRMAADFSVCLRVDSEELLAYGQRVGRLMDEADEHFRERLAHYFHRYAYNEWYPMSEDEFRAYAKAYKDDPPEPYPWQCLGDDSSD